MTASPASKKRLLAIQEWDRENTTQIHMKLNLISDADILRKLEEVKGLPGGKQGYIKALIREDINKRKENRHEALTNHF